MRGNPHSARLTVVFVAGITIVNKGTRLSPMMGISIEIDPTARIARLTPRGIVTLDHIIELSREEIDHE